MSPAQRTAASKRARRTPEAPSAERLRPWLLMGLVALLVARPLLPSEGVSWLGDGQPFNMLTMMLAAATCLLAMLDGGFVRRATVVDGAVAALVGLCVVSAFVGAQAGAPRLALNMLFEWLAMGLVYFLARQLVRAPVETRAVIGVMLALAVVLTGFGFYQVFVSLPADRAAYARDPDAVMRMMGQWFPPGSPERAQFENRLQSTEPLATFALANSLAGFLAPWLVIGLGIFASRVVPSATSADRGGKARWDLESLVRLVALAASLVAVATCLVLTKSRSAYVGVAVGVAMLPLFDPRVRKRLFNRWFVVGAGAVLLLVIGGAAVFGGLDAKVLSEATKSLGYRLEYWRSTWAMIARHPWLGVGPGNFQDYYTQYKLPQASEEIRDPHNFILEVWATAGTFAAVALCEALGAFAWRTWKAGASQAAGDHDAPSATMRAATAPAASADSSHDARRAALIVAGACAGFVIAFLVGLMVGLNPAETQLLGGAFVGAAVVVVVWPWMLAGALPARLPAVGVVVLSIHLLAAGGIAYPGVAGTFWLLLALGVNETQAAIAAPPARVPQRRFAWWPAGGLLLACAGMVGCYLVAYGPVVRGVAAMARANEANLTIDERINRLLDAAAADPIAAEPWMAIAELEVPRLKEDPDAKGPSDRFVLATRKMLELRPQSSSVWRQAGRWHYDLYRAHPGPGVAKAAQGYYRRAVELYPNLAPLRAEYALVLHALGESTAARQQIAVARQLDEQTAHQDKKLSPQMRRQLDELESQLR